MISPKSTSNLGEAYSQQYTDAMTAWRELNGKGKAENIIEVCKGHTFQKVLEVGAGEGSILFWLEKLNFSPNLYAVEISESAIRQIEKRNLSTLREVKIFDGYQIPYEDDAFDLIVCSHVIEHVEFPRLLLREIKRVSKYQVFEIPIDFSLTIDKKIDHFLSYGHINIYYPALFRFLLISEGFDILLDKAGFYSKEVRKAYLKNRKKDFPSFSYLKLYIKEKVKYRLWQLLPKKLKQIKPQVYTAICAKTDKDLKIF